jgi:hypothetical protein
VPEKFSLNSFGVQPFFFFKQAVEVGYIIEAATIGYFSD